MNNQLIEKLAIESGFSSSGWEDATRAPNGPMVWCEDEYFVGDVLLRYTQAVVQRCAEICRQGHDHAFGEAYRMAMACADEIEEEFGLDKAAR